ncbi:MAG: hypothetical protein WD208_06045 [Dehalococcoidia bacterium]
MFISTATLIYGTLMILIGLVAYLVSDGASITALIPAFIGVLILVLGLAAQNNVLLRYALPAAAAIAALALLGSLTGFLDLFALLGGEEVERETAVVSQSIVVLLSAVYLGIAIRSLVKGQRVKTEPPGR